MKLNNADDIPCITATVVYSTDTIKYAIIAAALYLISYLFLSINSSNNFACCTWFLHITFWLSAIVQRMYITISPIIKNAIFIS